MRTLTRRIPDITAPFARFTGRQRLSPYDRAIIHALERQRLAGLTIRAHVVDRPGHDSTSLLTHYTHPRHHRHHRWSDEGRRYKH